MEEYTFIVVLFSLAPVPSTPKQITVAFGGEVVQVLRYCLSVW